MWEVFIVLMLLTNSESHGCDDVNNLDISHGERFENGNIYYKGRNYTRLQYFTDNERICVCKEEVCMLKCCPDGYSFHAMQKNCSKLKEPFKAKVIDEYLRVQDYNAAEHFDINYRSLNCTPDLLVQATTVFKGRIDIRNDGKLYIEIPGQIPPWLLLGPDKYCVDTFIFEDGRWGNRRTSFDAKVCLPAEKQNDNFGISSICMIISCVFILATVAVYGWLPELRNLHGRVLMAYLLCLFVGFICMATMQILQTIDNISPNSCVTLSIIIYFSILAAFFWLHVMCFDIWWTFSGNRGLSTEKMSVQTKFNAYSIYAFGIPAALTIIVISLEFSDLPPHPLLPLLRQQGCFFVGKSKLLYLYGPIVIIWFSNMIFFVLTAVKIAQIKKQISVLKSRESAKHDKKQNKEKQRLFLYIKLFIVMGVSWLLEVISALYPEGNDVWRFVDAYNVLIGLFVFIIFVCKRKIFGLMKKRYKLNREDPLSKSQTSTRSFSTRDDIELTTRSR